MDTSLHSDPGLLYNRYLTKAIVDSVLAWKQYHALTYNLTFVEVLGLG